jgi:lipid II:glycine glycyltransferase (peptidoglycan interpeptide bridge formation enzyme)
VSQPVTSAAACTVREVRNLTPAEWDGLLLRTPGGGHLFQSYAWGELKRRLGWEPVRMVMERGGEVVGAGQFLAYNTAPVPGRLMYSPKGPWLPWEDEEAVRAFFEGVRSVAAAHNAHTVKIEPEVPADHAAAALLAELGFRKFRWDLNHKTAWLVNLSPSDEERMAGMKKDTRYGVRRAAREGVEVVQDDSPEAREAFWEMFENTASRKGFWYRPREYQFAAWRAMYDAGRAHLFFAGHEGERLAGALVYTFGEKCWYFQSASTEKKRNLHPGYLLQWEIMKWARERGVTSYDMMAVPGPDELNEDHPLYGVYKFKAGFGGAMADYVGCLDLPVAPTRAAAWNRLEPTYYRIYRKAKGDVYY